VVCPLGRLRLKDLAAFSVNSSRDVIRWWPRDPLVERGVPHALVGRPAFRELDGAPPEVYLRNRFNLPHDDEEAVRLHGSAIASGLSEHLVRPDESEIYVMLDVNSLYPALLVSGEVHYPACGRPEYRLDRPGWALARIEVPRDLWVSPIGARLRDDYPRARGEVVFPTGELEGVYSTDELRFILDCGGRVLEVYEAWSYSLRLPLRETRRLIEWLYERKQAAEGEDRDRWKAILNHGVGGLDNRPWWVLYVRPEYLYILRPAATIEEKEVLIGRERWMRLRVARESYQTGVFRRITALGRVKLARDVLRLREAGVLVHYVDTDCLVIRERDFDRAAGIVQVGKGLGEYSVRWIGRWRVWGVKRYAVYPLDGEPQAVVAGFRVTPDQIKNGCVVVQDPIRGTEVVSLEPPYERRRWPAESPTSEPLRAEDCNLQE